VRVASPKIALRLRPTFLLVVVRVALTLARHDNMTSWCSSPINHERWHSSTVPCDCRGERRTWYLYGRWQKTETREV